MENQYILSDNSQLKDFQCPVCLKYFSRKFTLDMHLLIHKGVKPHPCPFCDKSFRQKGTLMRHKALHSASNLFYCNLCNRGFRQKNVFLHHLKHQHNVSTECLDRRRYRTELKDYQSIMDTLPPFVHADSTAIASSEKHLDAMLLESLSSSVCVSSVSENLTSNVTNTSINKHLSCKGRISSTMNHNYCDRSFNQNIKVIQYQCSICLTYYNKYTDYRKHVEVSHNNVEMLLDSKPIICDLPSRTECSSSTDFITVSRGNSRIANNICSQIRTKEVSSHENINVCIPCQDTFNSVEEFDNHVKTHVQSVLSDSEMDTPNGTFLEECDNSSKSKSQLFQNENLSSPKENNKANSENEKTIVNTAPLINGTQSTIVCDENSVTNSRASAQNLIYEKYKVDLKKPSVQHKNFNLKFEQKSKVFKDKNSSMCSLSAFYKRLFKCKICDKIFHSKLIYEYHRQLHLNTRSYSCDYCKKRFSDKKSLLSHTRSMHMKIFQCNSCSRSFNYRSLYDFHKLRCNNAALQTGDIEKIIGLPLVDIRKMINSDVKGIVGVIPICDEGFSESSKIKIGIPIISLDAFKNASDIPFFNSIQVKGSIKGKTNMF